MGSYVVSVDAEDKLVGSVRDLSTGIVHQFRDVETLLAALQPAGGRGPDDGGDDPVEEVTDRGSAYVVRIEDGTGRVRALTPAQLRICYLLAVRSNAA